VIMSERTLAWFLGSLLLVTWALQIVGLQLVGDVDSSDMVPWLVGFMFMPTLWSVGYLVIFNRSAWKLIRFRLGNPIYLIVAALIPASLACGVLTIAELQGWAKSSFFTFNEVGPTVLTGPWVLGDGAQGWVYFMTNVAMTTLWFAALNSAVAVGEEFGWRGVVQHHMIERFGFVRGVALLGFVWAIWHVPVNLAGWNYPHTPALGAFVLFPIKLIADSFIMAWLTLRARSFWPAVLLHASGNGIGAGVMFSLTLSGGATPLTAALFQIGLSVAVATLCIALTLKQLGAQSPPQSANAVVP
jgi:membrane protease YdiL (CAAX protease family)